MLKWEVVHPKPGVFNFEPADQFVAFGEKHEMQVIGHTLDLAQPDPEVGL